MAEAAQSFCTSVVMGKDWIPRLTVQSFERLRDEMVSHVLHVRCVDRSWAAYATRVSRFS